MNSLTTLAREQSELLQQIIESEGEINPDVEFLQEQNKTLFMTKVDNYHLIMTKLKQDAEFYQARAEEFKKIQKRVENYAESMKERIKFAMEQLQTNEVSGFQYKFKRLKSRPKILIDTEKLPEEYKKAVIEIKPDKDKIEKDLVTLLEIPGVNFEDSYSLRVYVK